MAMHSAALLAKENRDLRAANEKEKQKRKQSRRQIAPNEGLCVQEARNPIQARLSKILRLKGHPRLYI
jgi:hypothetical protein